MKKNIFVFSVIVLLLMFGMVNAFGQGRFEVRITSNVRGASVFIDGQPAGVTPLTLYLARGSHTVKVTAEGYKDAETAINVTNNLTIPIDLERGGRPPEANTFHLRINSNVRGAKIYIDNRYMAETPATIDVTKGSHHLKVTAEGYLDYTDTINITRDTTLSADLQQAKRYYTLSITANVRDAKVYINDKEEKGYAPVSVKLEEGRYSVKVTKRGFLPFETTVTLNRDTRIEAKLNFSQPVIMIVIPDNILNRGINKPENRIDVFVDGKKQKDLEFTVERGRHKIRIETGGLALEKEINCREGVVYTVRLGFEMNISED